MHRDWLRRLGAVLMVVLACLAAPPALAQEAPAAEVSAEEIERLVDTLEDPAAREKLIAQLRALRLAQGGVEPEAPGLASSALAALSDRIELFGQNLLAATDALADAPRLAAWVEAQVRDPDARERWLRVIGKLLAILIAGAAVEALAEFLLRRPRARMDARTPESRMARAPLVVGRALLELVPVAAFALVAYGMVPLMRLGGEPRAAALMLITAYLSSRLAIVAARVAFRPRRSQLRLLPVGDETAHYLYIWARRLVAVIIYGYVLVAAASLLGLPASGYQFLLKLLGLLVATMMVVLILQNRGPVAGWIRSRGPEAGHRLRQFRNRLADVWHVLASLYVVMIYGIWALRIEGGFEFMLRATVLTVAILLIAAFFASLVRRLVDRGFAVGTELREQFPQLEPRVNRYLPVLHGVLRAAIALITVVALMEVWGADAVEWLSTGWGRRFVSGAVTIAIVLLVALVVWEVVSSSIERYLAPTDAEGNAIERSARARTLLPLLRNVIMILLLIVVGLTVLSELGVNIAPLLAGAGVVGLAIGFGSQKLVQDLITGIFILFEDTISVGDVVTLGEHTGLVEAMSVRTIRLRDLTGSVHTIPFSSVSTIVNLTKDFSFAVFDVGVAYREDTDQVVEVLKEIGAGLQSDEEFGKVILEPLEVLGVDRFGASEVVVKARIKTQPVKQWMVAREFNRRLKKRFDELGIEIPFPHQTVYFGQDKDGKAPPLHMALERKRGEKAAAEEG